MKSLLLLLAALPMAAADPAPALMTMDDIVSYWTVSRDFTLAVAEKMPEEDYGFKPNPEEMTFAQQLVHLSGASAFRLEQISGVAKPSMEFAKKADRATVRRVIAENFDYVIGVLPKLTAEQLGKRYKVDWTGRPEATGRQIVAAMLVHAAHHRAQCEVYLRVKGIQPPPYTF